MGVLMNNPHELKRAAKRLLHTPDGEALMAALAKRTVERPALNTAAKDGVSMALLMAVREGENSVYRWLDSLRQQEKDDV